MRLEQAIAISNMVRSAVAKRVAGERNRLEVARQATTSNGYIGVTPEVWAETWLPSTTFALMEISPSDVAVPFANRIDSTKVQYAMNASAENVEPIIIDVNVHGIGQTKSGFVPRVIVVEGKNRHRAQVLQGKDAILAWVGNLAASSFKRDLKPFEIEACACENQPLGTKLEGIVRMKAAVNMPVIRQDTGDGGPKLAGRMKSGGARSSGQLSDDKKTWKSDDPNFCAPGCDEDHEHNFIDGSPGSGTGPNLGKNDGATNSAQRKKIVADSAERFGGRSLDGGPIKVKKIVTKDKGK